MAAVPDDFGHWLAGFIDGEGCFAIERVKRSHGAAVYRPVFVLGVRIDDRAILEEIVCRTGLGALYLQPRGARYVNAMLTWHVRSRRDRADLVWLLEKYPLRAKKRHDFETWARAVHEHALMKHTGNSVRNDWSVLAQLRDDLRRGRRAGLPSNGSAEDVDFIAP